MERGEDGAFHHAQVGEQARPAAARDGERVPDGRERFIAQAAQAAVRVAVPLRLQRGEEGDGGRRVGPDDDRIDGEIAGFEAEAAGRFIGRRGDERTRRRPQFPRWLSCIAST